MDGKPTWQDLSPTLVLWTIMSDPNKSWDKCEGGYSLFECARDESIMICATRTKLQAV